MTSDNNKLDFIRKTRIMLTDKDTRQLLYFHNINQEYQPVNYYSDKKTADIVYRSCAKSIISCITDINNKIYELNCLDESDFVCLCNECFTFESTHINKVLKYIHINYETTIGLCKNVIGLVPFIRVVLIWIISHTYTSNVWDIDDVVRYFTQNEAISAHPQTIKNMIENIGLIILLQIVS